MKNFLKPTKGKVFTTILLVLLAYFLIGFGLNSFGLAGTDRCLPLIPVMPTPTPEPFNISHSIHDLTLDEGEYPCLKHDPSAQVAFSIQHTLPFIGGILLLFLLYLIVCTIIFFGAKLKKQKNSLMK